MTEAVRQMVDDNHRLHKPQSRRGGVGAGGGESKPMQDIFALWSVTTEELSQAILENGSLRGMVFGYVAEIKLRELLTRNPDVTAFVKDDDHDRSRKGDLRIVYKGQEFRMESKSLQTARNTALPDGTFAGAAQVDASDRRTVTLPDGSTLQTTNLLVNEFDVLAVNCFTFQNTWQWAFARNADLPRTVFKPYSQYQRQHLLATTVRVAWPPHGVWTDDVFALLDRMIAERQQNTQTPEVSMVQEAGKPPETVAE